MQNKILVLVPTFNRISITRRCVENLFSGTNLFFDLLISDSGSTDGTPEEFSTKENITVLNVSTEAWWTAAVNRGIEFALQRAAYDYILVLNDDIDIPTTLIEQLLTAAMEYPDCIISPNQESAIGKFLGMVYSKRTKHPTVIYADAVQRPIEVDTTNGCCLLIPVSVFQKVGVFDELNCPQLAADVEFQLRAKAAGFITIACPSITIIQHKNTNYYRKLKLTNLLTYAGSPVHLAAYLSLGRTLFGNYTTFAVFGLRHHFRYIKALTKAVLSCLRGSESQC